jgi:hypothetical protein
MPPTVLHHPKFRNVQGLRRLLFMACISCMKMSGRLLKVRRQVSITSEDDLLSVFGSPGNVNILYTGEIILAGDCYIEYDINSFTGCAGAIVFLLAENLHGSVQEGDYGNAIAVHGGAHPTLTNRNLGFQLREEHLF